MYPLSSLSSIFLTIAITVNLILAISVYRSNSKSATNRIYTILSIVISIWLVVNYTSIQPQLLGWSLFLIRLSLLFAALMNFLFLLFVMTLPKLELGMKRGSTLVLGSVTILVMILTLTSFVFSSVRIVNNSPFPVSGPGIVLFGLFSVILNALTVFVLVRRYKANIGDEKRQIMVVMIGFLAMFLGIYLTVFLPVVIFQSNLFVPLLPLYTLLFLGMTGYAIVTYHLFNFKVITAEALTLTLWIILGSKLFADTDIHGKMVDLLIFFGTVVFGIFLVRSVRKEVEHGKKLEILTQQLSEANEKLKELDHLKSEFLSFASHQIKAPLAAIKGFATLIYDGTYGEVSDKAKEGALKIKSSSDRLTQLVINFINIRKIEEGKMEYKFERINCSELVGGIKDELELLAKNKNLDYGFESVGSEVFINADVQSLRQVFQNLIENAIKYTDSGFIKVKVETKDNNMVFSVFDSGHGMSKELLPRLFEEFHRDKDEKRIEGSGLGLYIAKNIVEAHKGKIWAESDGEGKGSAFFVELPLA